MTLLCAPARAVERGQRDPTGAPGLHVPWSVHSAGLLQLFGGNLANTRIYRHTKRPEWGMAVFNDEIEDRVRFAFDDAQIRAFRVDSLHMLEVVELPEAEAAKVRAQLGRKRSVTSAGVPKKPKTAKAKPPAKTPLVIETADENTK